MTLIHARASGAHSKLTPRIVRERLQKQFGLEDGVLDAKKYKGSIKQATEAAVVRAQLHT
jgi:hypothetical protein